MALSVRKRGKVWHARGTVRIGRETIAVPEFSTGCDTRAAALIEADREETRIKLEHSEGPAGRAKRLLIAEAIAAYVQRTQGVSAQDRAKLEALNEICGSHSIAEIGEAWGEWRRQKTHHAIGTVKRNRALLLATVRHFCKEKAIPPPVLAALPKKDEGERVAMLTAGERQALLAAYSPHAACPALLLAHQGMRTQEVLRLDWRDVDFAIDTIRAGVRAGAQRTKTRKGRAVPMHPHVRLLLWGMWHAAADPKTGKPPSSGAVFLSSRGAPYEDTTDKGGNPLKKPHATACAKVGIKGFRVHDWRHDWAARMVMGGVDLFTLMRIGGWSSLKMVERYGAVSAAHLHEAMKKIA